MKLYKKIDILFEGKYICSTNQSRTCKDAVKRYLEIVENRKDTFAEVSGLDKMILRKPEGLRAFFDKSRK